MIGGLGTTELLIILGITLLIFGAGRIPEIAKSLGTGIREFKNAGKEIASAIPEVTEDESKDD